MALPAVLRNLRLPVIGSPMYIVSGPELVAAQCKAGIVGAFPALNARPADQLDVWLTRLKGELADYQAEHPNSVVGPFAVNHVMHPSNDRFERDIEVCVKHEVPLVLSSLSAPPPVLLDSIHDYGGVVFHDVTNIRHARKAADAGVDGLILVAAGAGGHGGTLSPFALLSEVRAFFDGTIVLAGGIATGEAILAAQTLGADLAYIGSRFLAAREANTDDDYRRTVIDSTAADIVYTDLFTGVPGNYLRKSIVDAGFDPDNLSPSTGDRMAFGEKDPLVMPWRDILGSGQGIGLVREVTSVREIVDRWLAEYTATWERMAF
ncbi:NAD(P)H-dependent flavin oxidoreductase [Kitasatospora sp. NPDC056651]|uniref:NAD(P)H-dependent flavin oxidoreductase n=1 Tax=Kitasatospora sp. NPDC056651 TaxID=3345892 RepID=UPI0036AE293C